MDTMDLSFFFKTKAQAIDFSARLAAVSQKIYETDFDLDRALTEQIGMQKKDTLLSIIRDNKITGASASDLKAFFETLQQTIAALPVLSLTVAFEPTEHTLQLISEWSLLQLKRQMLLEISVDPLLIAGTTINYNGIFKDFSWKTTFERILSEIQSPQKPDTQQKEPQAIENIHIGR